MARNNRKRNSRKSRWEVERVLLAISCLCRSYSLHFLPIPSSPSILSWPTCHGRWWGAGVLQQFATADSVCSCMRRRCVLQFVCKYSVRLSVCECVADWVWLCVRPQAFSCQRTTLVHSQTNLKHTTHHSCLIKFLLLDCFYIYSFFIIYILHNH